MKKIKEKVAVAMSGGVDSGVAAALLVRRGYRCAGFHMRLWSEPQSQSPPPRNSTDHLGSAKAVFENKCCSTESLEAARKTAHQLGMPFYLVNFEEIFKKKVVDYFLKEYGAGLTPNPCVRCNKFIKFDALLKYVRKLGYDYLATGHYARISPLRRAAGAAPPRRCLLVGKDKQKDQSYFLYNLTQEQLVHLLFPVGDYPKKEVMTMAKKWQLAVAQRPESQEICFFPESDYRPFLQRQIGRKIIPGEVVDTQGRVIGRHFGLPLYTIGQRHGFEINPRLKVESPGFIPPFYVIEKDIEKNQLIVGFGKETEKKEFLVKEVNWINPSIISYQLLVVKCQVRIRHQGERLACEIEMPRMAARRSCSEVKVVLEEAERGVAPGQAAVFYDKEKVLGGGIISTIVY